MVNALVGRGSKRAGPGRLEDQPQTVLDLAAVISNQFRCDLAEVGAGKINSGVSQVDVVENVVGLGTYFQFEAFG